MDPNNKYIVYNNDLKFKKHRDIDPKKAIFDPDDTEWYTESVEYNYNNTDFDTLEHRIKMCQNDGYSLLDLSYLDLTTIPNIAHHSDYKNLKNVKFICLDHNLIEVLGNELKLFENVEALDVSNNKLTNISYLPSSILELACHNNNIKSIISHSSLKRLDCSHNNIENIGNYPNLEQLVCDKNNIKHMQTFNKLTYLMCKDNPLISINHQPIVTYLDCSNTKVGGLFGENGNYSKLKHLVLSNTNITGINNLLKISTLDVIDTKLEKLPYISTLRDLTFNSQFLFDDNYKIARYVDSTLHTNRYIEFKIN